MGFYNESEPQHQLHVPLPKAEENHECQTEVRNNPNRSVTAPSRILSLVWSATG
jgi:hypothetical protein